MVAQGLALFRDARGCQRSVALGRDGYRRYARSIFETSATMQDAVRSHPELRILGRPTFLFSFTSDTFDVYHVNDFMRTRGWRFNGQQNPSAIHMCVTGPQTQPGIVETFAGDLAEAVAYAKNPPQPKPKSGGIYGGGEGLDINQIEVMKMFLQGALDAFTDYPF